MTALRYRLGLDLGSTSLGWAMIRLRGETPTAIIKTGSRIFNDGRQPKTGASLAVNRRQARSMRRRRDRLLKRKARMMSLLIQHGFFPSEQSERKSLERINPYALRKKGLDEQLSPAEFARALFHINQRRGFRSNRKTDRNADESGALKSAISALRQQLDPTGTDGKARTLGELLWRRMTQGKTVRARYREHRTTTDAGRAHIDKSYDLYVARDMIEAEFDALWAIQQRFNPGLFNEEARANLKDCLLHQRPLRPTIPGRCTLLPDEQRAPLALPSQQRFRIYQEVNNLRILDPQLKEEPLTLSQRDTVVGALEHSSKCTFTKIRRLLALPATAEFNLEDKKRQDLKGNITSAILGRPEAFGNAWFGYDGGEQDDIVTRLLIEESGAAMTDWLQTKFGLDSTHAQHIAGARLLDGYGSLSAKALKRILPVLQAQVITYDKAVKEAGFEHHSYLNRAEEIPGKTFDTGFRRTDPSTGEIQRLYAAFELPYYGQALQRHVNFGSNNPKDPPEKRYGRIANPTVHIGLNQMRTVVNTLIRRYGHPSEVVVEVARDLKQNQEQRRADEERQAFNQKRNERLRRHATEILGISAEKVRRADIQKLLLWEELGGDVADRRCPYSGVQISAAMVLSDEVEIEHILPLSATLDDSLNNKTLALRRANRIKGNRTPFEARADFEHEGWSYEAILDRAKRMPRSKGYRFGEDGYQRWLHGESSFLARALNDTRYLSRVAYDYLSLICPQSTRVIPGRMTAELRHVFGLNDILSTSGKKNRNDHRHHAVDACVIAVTDQGLLQRFAQATANARAQQLDRLLDEIPLPWPTFREHVARAVHNIWVSHKPEHGYQRKMFDETIYSAQGFSESAAKERSVIPFSARAGTSSVRRHVDESGQPKAYKGLLSNSNYCIEIVRDGDSWRGDVVSTYRAYEFARNYRLQNPTCVEEEVIKALRSKRTSLSGKPLVMRLSIDDTIRAEINGAVETLQVLKINSSGSITFIRINETNIPARYAAKLAAQKQQEAGATCDVVALNDEFFQTAISAGSLRNMKARQIAISPIGELHDPGFEE